MTSSRAIRCASSRDPSVRPGDAVAEQAGSVVDATIEAAFARAVEVLRGGGAAS